MGTETETGQVTGGGDEEGEGRGRNAGTTYSHSWVFNTLAGHPATSSFQNILLMSTLSNLRVLLKYLFNIRLVFL